MVTDDVLEKLNSEFGSGVTEDTTDDISRGFGISSGSFIKEG